MQAGPHQRQHQQIQPQHDPDQQPRQHAGAVGLLPEQRAKHRRRQLADSGKRDLADAGQTGLAADQAVNHIGQQQNNQNAGAPDVQQPATKTLVGMLGADAVAQQDRQYHIVRHHGAERDRRHDHHAGCRRGPPQEGSHGQHRIALQQRQTDDVGIGRHAVAEQHLTSQSDGHHKEAGQQQVNRENPACQTQITRLAVFHHSNLELPGQADEGENRNGGLQQNADDRRIALPVALQHRLRARLSYQVCCAAEQPEHHKQPDRQKRQQLDQRLKGNRQHHASVVLRHIQAAGPEQHGKQCQNQGDGQRGIFRAERIQWRCRFGSAAGKQAVAQHDTLELQRDIRQHGNQTKQRDDNAQALRLAVARGDKVGDGGNIFLLADRNHARIKAPAKQKQQQRPQVDGQKAPELVGRHADRTEKGPAGTPDGQRQAVDPDPQARLEHTRVAITPKGNDEQQGHVQQKYEGYQPTGKHHEARSTRNSVTTFSLTVPNGFAQPTSVVAGIRRRSSWPVPSAAAQAQPGCGYGR